MRWFGYVDRRYRQLMSDIERQQGSRNQEKGKTIKGLEWSSDERYELWSIMELLLRTKLQTGLREKVNTCKADHE